MTAAVSGASKVSASGRWITTAEVAGAALPGTVATLPKEVGEGARAEAEERRQTSPPGIAAWLIEPPEIAEAPRLVKTAAGKVAKTLEQVEAGEADVVEVLAVAVQAAVTAAEVQAASTSPKEFTAPLLGTAAVGGGYEVGEAAKGTAELVHAGAPRSQSGRTQAVAAHAEPGHAVVAHVVAGGTEAAGVNFRAVSAGEKIDATAREVIHRREEVAENYGGEAQAPAGLRRGGSDAPELAAEVVSVAVTATPKAVQTSLAVVPANRAARAEEVPRRDFAAKGAEAAAGTELVAAEAVEADPAPRRSAEGVPAANVRKEAAQGSDGEAQAPETSAQEDIVKARTVAKAPQQVEAGAAVKEVGTEALEVVAQTAGEIDRAPENTERSGGADNPASTVTSSEDVTEPRAGTLELAALW